VSFCRHGVLKHRTLSTVESAEAYETSCRC